ncbi:enoyl-CoA hydratase/isomerase family protein [Loktanella sp. F6476L]|uniref:enoyl-CoA hydratase/isomerase family protein n=1 Tax=Loktanella sp. F6476L TaxID=2926405 RepID=UPI001FF0EB10|nr:enoyl-CoA hydratase/isomerase family protein [Loktanella sp. F6476L]MCK0120376.1 enoyl-CoA hydratase/isomerase family protein [Loktanella sp. F6476L]
MIDYHYDDHVSTITINRPDKANALTSAMLRDLIDAVEKSHGSRVTILTGIGKVFSAGAALEEVRNGLATDPAWEILSQSIADQKGLTICALNGTLAGGAFGMALACDIRVAVPDARFFYPVMKMGVYPQPSDPKRMEHLIGPSRTKMMLLTARKIDAETALRWGLIDDIAAPGDLIDRAHELAAPAKAASLDLVGGIKDMIKR